MQNVLKKVMGLVLLASILSMSVFGAFVDMPADTIENTALQKAVDNGLLNGVGNNKIAPYQSITRSQMGAILVRAMGVEKKADIGQFRDVSSKAWYYSEMASAVYMGAFEGDGGTSLYPDKEITYQEAFLVLSRVFDLRYVNDGCLDGFSDKSAVASWAIDGVKKIVSGGYYDGKTLNPTAPISRVEFAKVMDKLVTTYVDTPGTYTEFPKGNTLVRCDGVVLDGVMGDGVNTATEGSLIVIGDKVKSISVINSKGVNLVVRGGNVNLSGEVGIVKAVMAGVVLIPDSSNISAKAYPDGTRGIIDASADGSYISLESTLVQ